MIYLHGNQTKIHKLHLSTGKTIIMGKEDFHHPPGLAKPSSAKSFLHCWSTITRIVGAPDSSWPRCGEVHYVKIWSSL